MSRFKLVYIVSLVVLGTLVGFALVRPAATAGEYSEVSQEQLIRTDTEYLIELQIANHEGRDTSYSIEVVFSESRSRQDVTIPDDNSYGYRYHIDPARLTGEAVNVSVFKEGQDSPFEEITYRLK